MYDFHIHSEYSIDSKTSMEKMVLGALDKNLKSICFTDHVDFESTAQKIDFVFRTIDYFKNIKQVKYKYMRNIEILAGVEVGIQPHLTDRYNKFINDNNFDFVLMSIHAVDKQDVSFDKFTYGLKPIDATIKYYEDMYECVKRFKNYDVLGHIDYIDRYFEDFSVLPRFDEYSFLIEDILKLIIQDGKGIEINTAGMRYGLNYFHPKIQILKLYKDLGGEIITVGSDAHLPEDIGYGYRSVERMLRDLGYKYIHIFKERKRFPINIA